MNQKHNSSKNIIKLIKNGYSCPPPRKAFVKLLHKRICREFESSNYSANKVVDNSGLLKTFLANVYTHWRVSAIGFSCIVIVGVLLLSSTSFVQQNETAMEKKTHSPSNNSGVVDKNTLAGGIGESIICTVGETVNTRELSMPQETEDVTDSMPKMDKMFGTRSSIISKEDKPERTLSLGATHSPASNLQSTANSISKQYLLKYDKLIPLSLGFDTTEDVDALKCAWVVFKRENHVIKAKFRLIIKSWPKQKWHIAIKLMDKENKQLATTYSIIENTGLIIGVPIVSEKDLLLTLGQENELSRAHSFNITIAQAPCNAKATSELESKKSVNNTKGTLSLKVSIAEYSNASHEFILWKRFDRSDDNNHLVNKSAIHDGQQIEWHDEKTNTLWIPINSFAYRVAKNEHVIKNLNAGHYIVTAVNSATDDPTPFGHSDIIELKNNNAHNIDVPVTINNTCSLSVKIVHIDNNKPIAKKYLVLRNADGIPITAASRIEGRFTNNQGIKEFGYLAPGNYQLEIGKSGWWNGHLYPKSNVKIVNLKVKANQQNSITVPY